ncbi:MAG: cpaB [Phenylobacterium sp.]|uniref:Flp pilus assembly protein CpaB n=1 Tax=Phenylobacterium sp. TaxID=1871053 RepID=UPI002622D4F9|nr:Flp pilus assembly protein CpaB [Phenylobacterium sp.]MDB5499307.1 cpaB [Phenylobacterium sp.]
MSIRTVATLAIAILMGLLAVFLVRNYLSSARGASPQAAAAGVPVVVASQAIVRGKVIEAGQLKIVRYPADAVPAGAFQSVTDLTGAAANKRLALRAMTPNEPVLATRVSGPGGRVTMSSAVTDGMRAVSLRSNDIAGVAGFVLPGDRVDILLTRAVEGGTVTQALAENVKVLGIDQSDNDEATNPAVARAVTVEVTPAQAQSISLAQAVGTVSLSLRHVADELPLVRKATTVSDLGFFGGRPVITRAVAVKMRAPPPPAGHEIRVTRGIETAGYRIP